VPLLGHLQRENKEIVKEKRKKKKKEKQEDI